MEGFVTWGLDTESSLEGAVLWACTIIGPPKVSLTTGLPPKIRENQAKSKIKFQVWNLYTCIFHIHNEEWVSCASIKHVLSLYVDITWLLAWDLMTNKLFSSLSPKNTCYDSNWPDKLHIFTRMMSILSNSVIWKKTTLWWHYQWKHYYRNGPKERRVAKDFLARKNVSV